jgi:hypothetical protein
MNIAEALATVFPVAASMCVPRASRHGTSAASAGCTSGRPVLAPDDLLVVALRAEFEPAVPVEHGALGVLFRKLEPQRGEIADRAPGVAACSIRNGIDEVVPSFLTH